MARSTGLSPAVGIDPSGRPSVERHLERDVGVPQSSNDGHRGGAVKVSGWGTRPGRFKTKRPGRLRVALNPSQIVRAAGALTRVADIEHASSPVEGR